MVRRFLACVMVVVTCFALAGCVNGNSLLDTEVTVAGLVLKIPSSWEEEQVDDAEQVTRFVPTDGGDEAIEVSYEEGYRQPVDAYSYLLDQRHLADEEGSGVTWEVAREMRLDEWTCNVFDVTEPTDDGEVSYQRAVIYGPTATYTVDVYGSEPTMELLLKTVGFDVEGA